MRSFNSSSALSISAKRCMNAAASSRSLRASSETAAHSIVWRAWSRVVVSFSDSALVCATVARRAASIVALTAPPAASERSSVSSSDAMRPISRVIAVPVRHA